MTATASPAGSPSTGTDTPPPTNRQWLLASRPEGPITDDTFRLVSTPVPDVPDGHALVRVVYLSVDPTHRIWVRAEESYLPPVGIGEVMRGGGIGVVEQTRTDAYAVGDLVTGFLGWQEWSLVAGGGLSVLSPGTPLDAALSVLGATGITGYGGMTTVGRPKAGETVVVSTAAGATGSVAAQTAHNLGARVVGIAGGPDKCAWVTGELGLPACIDYKGEDVGVRLDELCPDGIDVYFDNVGGDILDAVMRRLAIGARIVVCGAISGYDEQAQPLRDYRPLLYKRATMQGFLVLDYLPRAGEAIGQLSQWLAEGRLAYRVDVAEGFQNVPATLQRLFTGDHTGKLVVRVSPEPA